MPKQKRALEDAQGQGDLTGYTHAGCGGKIVYNGNYFCEHWRTCKGIMRSDEYDEVKGEWGPPELNAQVELLVAGLKKNRSLNYEEHGEMELITQ